jgi:hypothetical protein
VFLLLLLVVAIHTSFAFVCFFDIVGIFGHS